MVKSLSQEHKQLLNYYGGSIYESIRKAWLANDLNPYTITSQVTDNQEIYYYELLDLVTQWIDEMKALPEHIVYRWIKEVETFSGIWKQYVWIKELVCFIINSRNENSESSILNYPKEKFVILRYLYVVEAVFNLTYNFFDPFELNTVDRITGNTQLHNAILKKDIILVKRIVAYPNLDLSIQNRQNQTPLKLCETLVSKVRNPVAGYIDYLHPDLQIHELVERACMGIIYINTR